MSGEDTVVLIRLHTRACNNSYDLIISMSETILAAFASSARYTGQPAMRLLEFDVLELCVSWLQ